MKYADAWKELKEYIDNELKFWTDIEPSEDARTAVENIRDTLYQLEEDYE